MQVVKRFCFWVLLLALVASLGWQSFRVWDLSAQVRKAADEADRLRSELDDLEHGADRQLALAVAALDDGRPADAGNHIQSVLTRHPQSPEATEAQAMRPRIDEALEAERAAVEEAAAAAREATARVAREREARKEREAAAAESERRRKIEASPGKWSSRTSVSPIDDSTNEVVMLLADTAIAGKYGGTETPSLFIRCSENKTNVFINFGVYLGIDDTMVLTRLDSEKAVNQSWSISTDREAIFAASGRDVTLARQFLKHDTLFVQLTPYGEDPASTTFDLRGLKNVIGSVQAACGWR